MAIITETISPLRVAQMDLNNIYYTYPNIWTDPLSEKLTDKIHDLITFPFPESIEEIEKIVREKMEGINTILVDSTTKKLLGPLGFGQSVFIDQHDRVWSRHPPAPLPEEYTPPNIRVHAYAVAYFRSASKVLPMFSPDRANSDPTMDATSTMLVPAGHRLGGETLIPTIEERELTLIAQNREQVKLLTDQVNQLTLKLHRAREGLARTHVVLQQKSQDPEKRFLS